MWDNIVYFCVAVDRLLNAINITIPAAGIISHWILLTMLGVSDISKARNNRKQETMTVAVVNGRAGRWSGTIKI